MDASNDEWDETWDIDEDDDLEFEKEMNDKQNHNICQAVPRITHRKKKLIELLVFGYIRQYNKNNLFFPHVIISMISMSLQNLVDYSIKSDILTEFEKWILIELLFRPNNQKLKMNQKYSINLLYNANKDGYNSKIYHNKCDHNYPTITIIHSNYNHIFGGFTNVSLNNKHIWYYDEYAFLFLIRSNSSKDDKPQIFNIKPRKMDKSVRYHNMFGPIFGDGPDIFIDTNNKIGNCYSKTYSFPRNNMLCGDMHINDKLKWVKWNENDFDINDPDLYDQGIYTHSNLVKTFQIINYEVFHIVTVDS